MKVKLFSVCYNQEKFVFEFTLCVNRSEVNVWSDHQLSLRSSVPDNLNGCYSVRLEKFV